MLASLSLSLSLSLCNNSSFIYMRILLTMPLLNLTDRLLLLRMDSKKLIQLDLTTKKEYTKESRISLGVGNCPPLSWVRKHSFNIKRSGYASY
jgi:hypothetical protein